MNRFIQFALAALLLSPLAACGRAAPDAGEEAVLIRKPLFFGHGGIEQDPVKTGLSFTAWSTNALYVSVQPQSFDLAFNDMMSQDGIPLDFHSTVTLRVLDSVKLVQFWSGGGTSSGTENTKWYTNNIQPVLNNYVRDAFKAHSMHSLAIEATGTAAVEVDVRAKLSAYVAKIGIPVEVRNFTLGRVNPPNLIKQQRIKTAEEQQRIQTELQTKLAEDNRKAAETARAQADDAYRTAMGMNPEQFVELERIHMMDRVCKGHACTFIVGNGTALVNAK